MGSKVAFQIMWLLGNLLIIFVMSIVYVSGENIPLLYSFYALLIPLATVVYSLKHNRVGALGWLAILIYLLPFNHLLGYLIFGYDDVRSVWTLNPKIGPYLTDRTLVDLVGCIMASAVLGIAVAVSLNCLPYRVECSCRHASNQYQTLNKTQFVLLLLVSIFLAWASMPSDSIINVAYTESSAKLSWFNWPSAWLLSYVIIAILYSDCILDKSRNSRRKLIYLNSAMFYLVVVNDLGSGKRTSIPLLFALFFFYVFHYCDKSSAIGKNRGLVTAILAVIVVFIANLHGALRGELFDINSMSELVFFFNELLERNLLGFNMLTHGTWTDVLMTPFSAAFDYIDGRGPSYGVDYWNMVLSIPPAFLASAIDYTRPWDSSQGPAWEMIFGNGGIHATVLPFRNFGLIGVVAASAIYITLLLIVEKRIAKKYSVLNISMYISVISVLPHWLWYGEKPIINALIYVAIMNMIYHIMVNGSRKKPKPEHQ